MFIRILADQRADSKKLYEEIKQFGVNVTDMVAIIFIYGECSEFTEAYIRKQAKKHGKIID